MIVVVVEHYLNQEGKEYFPVWVNEVRSKLQNWSGFIRVSVLQNDDTTRCFVYLEVHSRHELHLWASSRDHSEILDKLIPYRIKKHKSMTYEMVDPNNL